MFKIVILCNNKRESRLVNGEATPNQIIAEFGGSNLKFSLNGITLRTGDMDTPIGDLAATFNLPDSLLLTGVVKTDNA